MSEVRGGGREESDKISLKSVSCLSEWKLLSHVNLCDPMDCSPPGSYVHGILQARILEWVAVPFSMESSQHCLIGHNCQGLYNCKCQEKFIVTVVGSRALLISLHRVAQTQKVRPLLKSVLCFNSSLIEGLYKVIHMRAWPPHYSLYFVIKCKKSEADASQWNLLWIHFYIKTLIMNDILNIHTIRSCWFRFTKLINVTNTSILFVKLQL